MFLKIVTKWREIQKSKLNNSPTDGVLIGDKREIGERRKPRAAWEREKAREPLDFVYILI